MKKILCIVLALATVFAFAACGKDDAAKDFSQSVEGALVVAEAGSAGEELANGEEFFKGAEFTPVDSMAKALMEVASGTADGAVIDKITALAKEFVENAR